MISSVATGQAAPCCRETPAASVCSSGRSQASLPGHCGCATASELGRRAATAHGVKGLPPSQGTQVARGIAEILKHGVTPHLFSLQNSCLEDLGNAVALARQRPPLEGAGSQGALSQCYWGACLCRNNFPCFPLKIKKKIRYDPLWLEQKRNDVSASSIVPWSFLQGCAGLGQQKYP